MAYAFVDLLSDDVGGLLFGKGRRSLGAADVRHSPTEDGKACNERFEKVSEAGQIDFNHRPTVRAVAARVAHQMQKVRYDFV